MQQINLSTTVIRGGLKPVPALSFGLTAFRTPTGEQHPALPAYWHHWHTPEGSWPSSLHSTTEAIFRLSLQVMLIFFLIWKTTIWKTTIKIPMLQIIRLHWDFLREPPGLLRLGAGAGLCNSARCKLCSPLQYCVSPHVSSQQSDNHAYKTSEVAGTTTQYIK